MKLRMSSMAHNISSLNQIALREMGEMGTEMGEMGTDTISARNFVPGRESRSMPRCA